MSDKPWSAPTEVQRSEMNTGVILDPEKYDFYLDVVRRLEQTKSNFAIQYKFSDYDTAKLYRNYTVRRIRQRRGKQSVNTSIRRNGAKETCVYFARDENF